MAMLSARFRDVAAAERVVRTFIDSMNATPNLVILKPETQAYEGQDIVVAPENRRYKDTVEFVCVEIYDNAINPDDARRVFEDAGGTDIRPIQ